MELPTARSNGGRFFYFPTMEELKTDEIKLDLETFRAEGIDADLKQPKKRKRELLADLRYLGNSGWPRLEKGEAWGEWDKKILLRYFAKIVDVLRSEVGYAIEPPEKGEEGYDSSYWRCYRQAEKYMESKPPEAKADFEVSDDEDFELPLTELKALELGQYLAEQGVRPAFGSPGGKRALAKTIAALIPPHKTYVEPFAGGAAVFFAKKLSEKEILGDLNADLIFVLKAIKNLSDSDLSNLEERDWVGNKKKFYRFRDEKSHGKLDKLYQLLYLSAWSYRGFDSGQPLEKWTLGSTDKLGTEKKVVLRLPNIRDRFKDTVIVQQDFEATIKDYDSSETFFYLDPPYPGEWSGGTDFNIVNFAKILKSLKGEWLISLNDLPSHRKAFSNFDIRTVDAPRFMGQLGETLLKPGVDRELLIANYPLPTRIRRRKGSTKANSDDELKAGRRVRQARLDQVRRLLESIDSLQEELESQIRELREDLDDLLGWGEYRDLEPGTPRPAGEHFVQRGESEKEETTKQMAEATGPAGGFLVPPQHVTEPLVVEPQDRKRPTKILRLTFIGTGAMGSQKRKGAALLIEYGGQRVQIDGEKPGDIQPELNALRVTDPRAWNAKAAVEADGTVGHYESGGLAVKPRKVKHTAHDVYGYLIEAGGKRVAYLPELWEWPEWAENLDLAIVDGSAWKKDIAFGGGKGGHRSVLGLAETAAKRDVKRVVATHVGQPTQAAVEAGKTEEGLEIAKDGERIEVKAALGERLASSREPVSEREVELVKKLEEGLPDRIIMVEKVLSVTGSQLYAREREPNDCDLLLKAETNEKGLFVFPFTIGAAEKIRRLMADLLKAEEFSWLDELPGPNWRYLPIYDFAFLRRPKLEFEPVNEPEFAELEYKALTEKALERLLRGGTAEIRKQAMQSYREDKIVPGRMFVPLKPLRPADPSTRQTFDKFLDYVNGMNAWPVWVSPKRDGARHVVHRNGERIRVFSDDGKDNTDKLEPLVGRWRKFGPKTWVVDTEVEYWTPDGQHYPREAAAGAIHKGEGIENLVFNIFRVLFWDGKDLHKEPFGEIWEVMEKMPVDTRSGGILRPSKEGAINLVPHIKVGSLEALKKAALKIAYQPGVEGVVVKRDDGPYPLTGDPGRPATSVKWHKNAAFRVIVLDRKETKTKGVYNYFYGVAYETG